MPSGKMKKVGFYYHSPFERVLENMYGNKKLSSIEIAERIERETTVVITPRFIQKKIKSLGIMRSLSEAFNLAIAKGRKDYSHLRKPIKAELLRRGITLKTRYAILRRDNFRCVLCGTTAVTEQLEIDHITPVVNGGTNNESNLRILCRPCNRGKKSYENER
jgi:5-methylcytosine-specific restriction endonuclease McrA